jgi:hypothetical protein
MPDSSLLISSKIPETALQQKYDNRKVLNSPEFIILEMGFNHGQGQELDLNKIVFL